MKQEEQVSPLPAAPVNEVAGDAALAGEWANWSFGSYYVSQIDAINEANKEAIEHLLATDPVLKAEQEALAAATANGHPKS